MWAGGVDFLLTGSLRGCTVHVCQSEQTSPQQARGVDWTLRTVSSRRLDEPLTKPAAKHALLLRRSPKLKRPVAMVDTAMDTVTTDWQDGYAVLLRFGEGWSNVPDQIPEIEPTALRWRCVISPRGDTISATVEIDHNIEWSDTEGVEAWGVLNTEHQLVYYQALHRPVEKGDTLSLANLVAAEAVQ